MLEKLRKAVVAGNWKMYGDKEFVAALTQGLKQNFFPHKEVQLIVFPPYVYLDCVNRILHDSDIALGAQNLSANEPGAYTGEIAATMLRDIGCRYVLVGHSERRKLYHEDNVLVAMKFVQAQQHGLTPILCVGETFEQRRESKTFAVIEEQLSAVLQCNNGVQQFRNAMVAYEPVWAIGTGEAATPEVAQQVHAKIREFISSFDPEISENLTLLYGGSVKASNAKELFSMPDIDGGLVGGASLDAHEFLEIAKCIN